MFPSWDENRVLAHRDTADLEALVGSGIANILRTRLRTGDVFIDVGAKNGVESTLAAARAVGAKGRVIALEPHPDRFRRLLHNVAVNRSVNIVCVLAAASDETISATLFHEPPRQDVACAGHSIHVERVDRLCLKLGCQQVDLVKIDVSGSELLVLRGMNELLGCQAPPKILCRISKCSPGMFQSHCNRIAAYMAEYGYAAKRLGPNFITRSAREITTVQALIWFDRSAPGESFDVFSARS